MINPTELCIGNYVNENLKGLMKVKAITTDFITCISPNHFLVGSYNLDEINPIELTDEWL